MLQAIRREVKPFEFMCATLGMFVALLALPVVIASGAPVEGWMIGLMIWLGSWALGLAIGKFATNLDSPQAIGISGMSFMVRAWTVFGTLFVVAAKYDRVAGLTAGAVFGAAFTFDLMGRTMLHALRSKSAQARAAE